MPDAAGWQAIPAGVPGALTYADPDRDPLEMQWTWPGRLPRAAVVIVAGWRESAKGLMTCKIAADITNGTPMPGETGSREPGDVVIIGAEDDPNEDMAWRLRAAGADLSRVFDLSELPDGSPFELSASASEDGHTPELLAYLRRMKDAGRDPRLVIMDPLNALAMTGSIKTDQGARRVMGRLRAVAKRTGVTILVVHHFVKSGSIAGSQGLVNAARWVYTVEPDELNPEYKVLHLEKCNQGGAEDLRYRIIRDGHDSRIAWVDRAEVEREDRSWREPPQLHAVPDPPPDASAHDRVLAWLERGGGDTADCAKATGLSEDECLAELHQLAAGGIAGQKRRLSLRR